MAYEFAPLRMRDLLSFLDATISRFQAVGRFTAHHGSRDVAEKTGFFWERGKISMMIDVCARIGPLPSLCGSTHWPPEATIE
jgi:hypothetical protein